MDSYIHLLIMCVPSGKFKAWKKFVEPKALKVVNNNKRKVGVSLQETAFLHKNYEEGIAMDSYNHLFIMRVPSGNVSLVQSLKLPCKLHKINEFASA